MYQPNDADCVTPGMGSSEPAGHARAGVAPDDATFLESDRAGGLAWAGLDDDGWPDDAAAVLTWRARRPRRIAVKLLGWAMLCVSGWGAVRIAEDPKAREAMESWASMGQIDPSHEARGVVPVPMPVRTRAVDAAR